jgi:5-methylcytosine-specific restriction endonuclease McrA
MKNKKQIRDNFRNSVYKRDKFTCQVCKTKRSEEELDAHHITDRNEMPNGGYVPENGITVCKEDCHFKVEQFHINEGESWEEGLHPDDLYKKINSSKELAIEKSNEL